MSAIILAIVGGSACIVAWAGYGVPAWLGREVLWLSGVIVCCTAAVLAEKAK